jgi:hypothetical protein
MAAGTEIVQPVSALDGAYKPTCLDDGKLKKIGGVVDNKNSSATEKSMVDRDNSYCWPPRPISIRGCVTRALFSGAAPASDSVVLEGQDTATVNGKEGVNFEFQPVYRSGVWSDTGRRTAMEDAHVCIDNLQTHLGSEDGGEAPGAFYGVSDIFPLVLLHCPGSGGCCCVQYLSILFIIISIKAIMTYVEYVGWALSWL